MNQAEDKTIVPSQNVSSLAREAGGQYATYDEFILWFALPAHEKIKMGIETHEAFADYHGLNRRTITRWKARSDFYPKLKALRDGWARDRTSDVIAAMYKTAMKGNPLAQVTWMKVFEGFTEKTETTMTQKVEIGVGDIRFLIEQLPEPLKSKHYANLRELLDDATAFESARNAEDSNWTTLPEDGVSREADPDAQDIPDADAHEVAAQDKTGIRVPVGREVHTRDHQSSSRRGQESIAGDGGIRPMVSEKSQGCDDGWLTRAG